MQATIALVEALPDHALFNVFGIDVGLHAWQTEPRLATPENKEAAAAWLRAERSVGGPITGRAVARALGHTTLSGGTLIAERRPVCGTVDQHVA